MQKIHIEVYGQLTDITNASAFELDDAVDSGGALEKIYEKYPLLRTAKFVTALNNTIIHQNTKLPEHATLALMPAFSGG